MDRVPGEQELRIRRSLQKLDLPEWAKKSSRERLFVSGQEKGGATTPRWSELRQRSTSASSLGFGSAFGDRSAACWSASSSFRKPQQQHVGGSVSATASGRQSKESLLQSPMSPSSIGLPWSAASSFSNRPHSAFNYYSYQTGYSSASVSRCSSSRSTSPTASITLTNPIKSPYKQPYLGWRSSEKLAREMTSGAAGSNMVTTPTTSTGYFYRSPAERLSKGPGYYAMKFGMYQHHKPAGNYVRQMVEEIEKVTRQQMQQPPQRHPEITVNVIGPSPSELIPSPSAINGDESDGENQVENMVREMGKLIHQNGEADDEEALKSPAMSDEASPTSSEKMRRFVWMESSFVGVRPTNVEPTPAENESMPAGAETTPAEVEMPTEMSSINKAIINEAQTFPLPQQTPFAQVNPPESPPERKLSLSSTTMDDVLDSLLALPSTSSNRNSPLAPLPEQWPQPSIDVNVNHKISWDDDTGCESAAEEPIIPSAPPMEDNEEESEVVSNGSSLEEEVGSSTSNSTSSSNSGEATSNTRSESGCSSSSEVHSMSSISQTAATTICTSSSTGCSDTSCNQESHCSSSHSTEKADVSSPPSEPCPPLSANSISLSTEESLMQNEEKSEGSSFPPPPSAQELQQIISTYDEELALSEHVIQVDEQPLSGVVRNREWRVGSRRSLRPDYLDDSSLVQCSQEQCEKSIEMREARHIFKTCHNCYTFYCSRECRKEHWEKHRLVCMYGRVRSLCKQALQYSRENSTVLQYLSKIARTGLLTQGRGFVKLLFRNTEMAVRFLREGWPQLEDGPIYVGWRNFLPEEMGDDVYRVVVELCQTYDPQIKFLLVVAIFVTREVPIRSVPHWEREIIAKCAKISLAKNCVQDHINNTLILTGPTSMSRPGMSEKECRQACLESIEYRLRERGVNLRLNFPDVYHRLCSYVENDEPFPPITIYPKDGLTGQLFMCVIMPNTGNSSSTSNDATTSSSQ